MKINRNNGVSEDNVAQNRFTAYLQTSIRHQKAKYIAKLQKRKALEISYDDIMEFDLPGTIPDLSFSRDEIENDALCRALEKLKERDKTIVLRRAVYEESFIKIAADLDIEYVTVKAVYYRSLAKIKKEMLK